MVGVLEALGCLLTADGRCHGTIDHRIEKADRYWHSIIIKFVGKGFGSLAASNAALRNAEWASNAKATPPGDQLLRCEDALVRGRQAR